VCVLATLFDLIVAPEHGRSLVLEFLLSIISYYYLTVFPVLLAHKTLLYYFKIYKTAHSWLILATCL